MFTTAPRRLKLLPEWHECVHFWLQLHPLWQHKAGARKDTLSCDSNIQKKTVGSGRAARVHARAAHLLITFADAKAGSTSSECAIVGGRGNTEQSSPTNQLSLRFCTGFSGSSLYVKNDPRLRIPRKSTCPGTRYHFTAIGTEKEGEEEMKRKNKKET